jgi:hypothetical protein
MSWVEFEGSARALIEEESQRFYDQLKVCATAGLEPGIFCATPSSERVASAARMCRQTDV